jgi:type IV secretion system protein VirD4
MPASWASLFDGGIVGGALVIGLGYAGYRIWQNRGRSFRGLVNRASSMGQKHWVDRIEASPDPLQAARQSAAGLGSFLGVDDHGNAAFGASEAGTLVIGPPRGGKTSGIVVPMLLLHNGPAVVTSTKDEVARVTSMARQRYGRVFIFDPTGQTNGLPPQIELLRWSPLQSARRGWLEAVKMGKAMTEASVSRAGVENATYWTQRASQLLAALLYAATRSNSETRKPYDMGDVVEWVSLSSMLPPQEALLAVADTDPDAKRALQQLVSVLDAPEKERGGIISTTYTALEAYNSGGAVTTSSNPNFDGPAFVASAGDTIYITASSEDQAAVAPLVVGLLQDIRRAAFAQARRNPRGTFRNGPEPDFVLFLLDEVANIAPIGDLPELASEAGGQGIRITAILQNLPQAANRWGKERAYGMLSTFGQVIIFGGTRDPETLQTLSTLLGQETRYTPTVGFSNQSAMAGGGSTTSSWSQQVFPVATPAEISQIPEGWLLVFVGTGYSFLYLSQYHRHHPWGVLLQDVYQRGWHDASGVSGYQKAMRPGRAWEDDPDDPDTPEERQWLRDRGLIGPNDP